ncbi:MAG: tRNA (guanine(10)-N(2))-dimethyltransferase [DPANN group archaeon]|nr:tRNA (guanine(10)-N(2))-dimethyltransferase [DPANN group archaeon]
MADKSQKIIEGKCSFRIYSGDIKKSDSVFYNPLMRLNRDISVIVLNEFSAQKNKLLETKDKVHPFFAADVFCASGVRGIRYRKESGCDVVYLNDLNPTALDLAKENAILNDVDSLEFSLLDANEFLSGYKDSIDFVDIDPFGSPNIFLDSAARALSRYSMIAVTATDTAPLSGTYPKACFRKYGARPLHHDIMHEVGLRILMGQVAFAVSRYDKAFMPVLSFSDQHYFRIFAIATKGKTKTDNSLKNIGYVAYCTHCGFRTFLSSDKSLITCPKCSKTIQTGGPLWIGSMSDSPFLKSVLDNFDSELSEDKNVVKMYKFLNLVMEESKINYLFYDLHDFCKKNSLSIPKMDIIIEKLKSLGFSVSKTHFTPTGIRTDADVTELILSIQDKK